MKSDGETHLPLFLFSIFKPGISIGKTWPVKKPWCFFTTGRHLSLPPNIPVGGFNPFERYARQIGSFPQRGVNIKNIKNIFETTTR